MEITHVIRAEEWLPSTPKHVLLYEAFGWTPPTFAHVPLLLNPDRSKMSKRHGDVMVRDFAAKGYFPEALVNFVALCGWNPGGDNEKFSMHELINAFSLERVNKAGAVFDYKKLEWMNGEYLKSRDPQELASALLPTLQERRYTHIDSAFVANVVALLRERVTFLQDIAEFGDYLFSDTLCEIAADTLTSITSNQGVMDALRAFHQDFSAAVLTDEVTFKALAQASAERAGIKMGAMMKPLRLVLTHREVGADLFRTLQLIGAERCSHRLAAFFS
jgi:nondiscriminating glutamyl-tRNA synthetase